MKIYEIIAFNREILDRFERIGIRPDDHKHLPLYNDYRAMKARREKMTYIVAVLAERYAVSERKVYNIIAHLEKDCTERAVIPPRIVGIHSNKSDFRRPKTHHQCLQKFTTPPRSRSWDKNAILSNCSAKPCKSSPPQRHSSICSEFPDCYRMS